MLGYAKQDKKRELGKAHKDPKLATTNEIRTLLNQSNERCFYCWRPLYNSKWSLDRTDCTLNHTFDNCVISCINCNTSRSNRLFKQFYRESVLKRLKVPTIHIIDEDNKKVFNLMKDNIVGGASIVFHRYHEKNVTKIQRVHYDKENNRWYYDKFGKIVKKIVGFDANALSLWCIGQPQ